MIKPVLIINFLFLMLFDISISVVQKEYYPIIFVHGHSGKIDVEETWDYITTCFVSQNGYAKYGKIWANSSLPNNMMAQTMFMFGFYRNNQQEEMGSTIGKIGGLPVDPSNVSAIWDSEIRLYFGQYHHF